MGTEESLIWKPSVERITSPKVLEISEEKRQRFSKEFRSIYPLLLIVNITLVVACIIIQVLVANILSSALAVVIFLLMLGSSLRVLNRLYTSGKLDDAEWMIICSTGLNTISSVSADFTLNSPDGLTRFLSFLATGVTAGLTAGIITFVSKGSK